MVKYFSTNYQGHLMEKGKSKTSSAETGYLHGKKN